MRLWKRASGALKDQNSLWKANLSRRTSLRNPDIDKAVIRATTHHDLSFDTRNADRVCNWLRLSPSNLHPILRSISHRVHKTRSWVVALKALYLMHSLTNTRLPCVKKIGRLPFDLSSFSDHSSSTSWPFISFVRAYYSFLDNKSTVIFQHAAQEKLRSESDFSIGNELILLQKLQSLVDLLMQIKPQSRAVFVPLVLHTMDGVVVEIYDLYSRICRGIAVVLLNIYSGGKSDAAMALSVVKKATTQGEDLTRYFEYCHEIGVVSAAEFPVIDQIPDEGIQELEQIKMSFDKKKPIIESCEEKEKEKTNNKEDGLKTIVTDEWESFEEDLASRNGYASPPVIEKIPDPPDLITF